MPFVFPQIVITKYVVFTESPASPDPSDPDGWFSDETWFPKEPMQVDLKVPAPAPRKRKRPAEDHVVESKSRKTQ